VKSVTLVLCMLCDVLASEIIQVEETAELGYMMYAEGIVSFVLLTIIMVLLHCRAQHIRRMYEKCCFLFRCIDYSVRIDK
jgi:hypothetical protein